jgi:hypothetical protein
MGKSNQAQRSLWLATALLLMASWLSIQHINSDALYIDERLTIVKLGDPYELNTPVEIITYIEDIADPLPPGYYILLSVWIRLVGYSQGALRYASVLAAILGIAITYRMVGSMISRRAGLYAMALLSVSTLYIYYAHELKMYALLQPLIAWFLWNYFRVIQADKLTRWDWVGLTGSVIALLYVHYLSIFPIFGVCVYHLFFVPKTHRWWHIILAFGIAGLLFVPWIGAVLQATSEVSEHGIASNHILETIWLIPTLFGNGNIILSIATVGMLSVGLWFVDTRTRHVAFIMFVSIGALLIVDEFFVSLLPSYRARYHLIHWTLLAFVIGAVLARLIRWHLGGIMLIAVWLVAGQLFLVSPEMEIYNNRDRLQQWGYPPYAQMMREFGQSNSIPGQNDLIVAVSSIDLYDLQIQQDLVASFYFKRLNTNGISLYPRFSTNQEMREKIGNPLAIWLVYEPNIVTQEESTTIKSDLENRYQPCDVLIDETDIFIQRYVAQPLTCHLLDTTQPAVDFASIDLQLMSVETVIQDTQLFVGTTWDVGENVPPHHYSVSLKVYNAQGDFVAQQDYELPFGHMARHLAIFDALDWTGTYTVTISVYDWQTGARLTINGVDEPTEVTVGTIMVE